MKVKDPRPPLLKKGVVYRVPCMDCDMSYIGETGRNLKKRLVEHKEAVHEERRHEEWHSGPCMGTTASSELG